MTRRFNTRHFRKRSRYPERLAARGLSKAPMLESVDTLRARQTLKDGQLKPAYRSYVYGGSPRCLVRTTRYRGFPIMKGRQCTYLRRSLYSCAGLLVSLFLGWHYGAYDVLPCPSIQIPGYQGGSF